MDTALSLGAIVVEILFPPASLAAVALLILVAWRTRWGRRIALLPLSLLVILSMPVVSRALMVALDLPPQPAGADPGAIVILSADVEPTAEPGGSDLGALTLERERAGAALYRLTDLPVLVTGGLVTAPPPVAFLMARSMQEDFHVPVRWIELRSSTTWENASFSAPMLKEAGITRVFVVTHAWHMRRSLLAFRRAGIEAVPWVVRSDPPPAVRLSEFFPRASAWMRSYYALHEWVGLLFYSLRS